MVSSGIKIKDNETHDNVGTITLFATMEIKGFTESGEKENIPFILKIFNDESQDKIIAGVQEILKSKTNN